MIHNTAFNKADLLALIKDNGKLEAIRFVKDTAQIGLSDAQTVVDNLLSNPDFYDAETNATATDNKLGTLVINDVRLDLSMLISTIHNDSKLNAIKIIKAQTGIALNDCKEIVDNLAESPIYYVGQNNTLTFSEANPESPAKSSSQNSEQSSGSNVIEQAKPGNQIPIIVATFVAIGIVAAVVLLK